MTWYGPPPSQNRTWRVTPSGSQPESSTAGWVEVMNDPRAWQMPGHFLMIAVPCHAAALTASIQPFEQQPTGVIHILLHAAAVATDSEILDMALKVAADKRHHGFASVRSQCGETHVKCLEFLPDAFALSPVAHNEASVASAPDEVRETQKVKGLRPMQPLSFALRASLIAKPQ